MVSEPTGSIAVDFPRKEEARQNEFSGIWKSQLDAVFSDVAKNYDFASNLASLGMCDKWRDRFISSIDLKAGDKVLDVCAGTNAVGIRLLRRQPDAQVFAIDQSQAMQDVGAERARRLGMHIDSTIGDVHHLPYPDEFFDVITLQWASRHLRIVDVLSEVRRVLKPGGCFYHCDMLRPESQIVGALYSAYLKACVSTTARLFGCGPEARSCQDYFVRAVEMFYSSKEFTQLLLHLGFRDVSCQAAIGGTMACHKAAKPS